jgi:hypothetical protein
LRGRVIGNVTSESELINTGCQRFALASTHCTCSSNASLGVLVEAR